MSGLDCAAGTVIAKPSTFLVFFGISSQSLLWVSFPGKQTEIAQQEVCWGTFPGAAPFESVGGNPGQRKKLSNETALKVARLILEGALQLGQPGPGFWSPPLVSHWVWALPEGP